MKKLVIFCLMAVLFLSARAQEEVVFNLKRTKAFAGSAATITFFINGAEAVRLRNGGSFIYKADIDLTRAVSIMVKSGLSKREIFVKPDAGNKINLETGFRGAGIDLVILSGAKLVPASGTTADMQINKKDLSVAYTSVTTNSTDTIRQQWLEKGGKIMGISYVGGAIFTRMDDPSFSMTGAGGTFTISGSFLNFKIPEYGTGLKTWNSMILGYSVSDQFLGTTTKIKMDVPIPGFDPVSSSFSVNMLLSFNGGYTFGLGKFRQETKWKGVAFDLTYRPSIIMSISTAGTTTNVDFNTNFTGFGFDLNFNNFTANAARLAPKAQSKFTFFMLPPVGDLPLYVSVGYGVTFYTKLGQPMLYQQKRTGARK